MTSQQLNTIKTIALLGALFAFFAGIVRTVLGLGFLLALLGVVAAAILLLFWLRRGAAESRRGAILLTRGLHSEALAEFVAAIEKRDGPTHRANLGHARLLLFEFEEALAEFERVRWLWSKSERRALAHERELCRVLLGQAQSAKPAPKGDPMHALIEGVQLTRQGDWANAERLLRSHEARQLGGVFRDLGAACEAWCAWRLRQEVKPLEGSTVLHNGRLARLSRAWPELGAFVGEAR